MKALFLVGGAGTRLRPLTDHLPKPMIPILGRPLLERTFTRLKDCGISDMVLSACYKPDKIIEYFQDGSEFGLNMEYVVEDSPLGTGGAIKNAEQYFDDPFFIFNADILCDVPLGKMLDYHRSQKADITIAATYVEDPTAYGVLEYNSDGYVTQFTEKPAPDEIKSHYINAGIYIFEPHVLRSIAAGKPVSVEREVFPSVLEKGGRIAIFRDFGYWMDIGTPQKYVQAHLDILAGRCKIAESDFEKYPLYVEDTAEVHGSVSLRDYVFIGKHAQLDSGTIIGSNVTIGDDAHIGHDCHITDSIIWPGASVPDSMEVNRGIVADINGEMVHYPYEMLNIPLERGPGNYGRH